MNTVLSKLIISALIVLVSDYLFDSVIIDGFMYAVLLVIILGFLNATVKPIIKLFSLPLNLMTFGLFNLVITVLIVKIADALMGSHFETEGFLGTLGFALVISILNSFVDLLISDK